MTQPPDRLHPDALNAVMRDVGFHLTATARSVSTSSRRVLALSGAPDGVRLTEEPCAMPDSSSRSGLDRLAPCHHQAAERACHRRRQQQLDTA